MKNKLKSFVIGIVLLVSILISLPLPVRAAVVLVQQGNNSIDAGSTSITCVLSSATSVNNVFTVEFGGDSGIPGISDSLSATWTTQVSITGSSTGNQTTTATIWSAPGKTGASDTITLTFGSSNKFKFVACQEWSGLTSSTAASTSSGKAVNVATGTSGSISVTSFTPVDFVIEAGSIHGCNSLTGVTVTSGFTALTTSSPSANGQFCTGGPEQVYNGQSVAYNLAYSGGATTLPISWSYNHAWGSKAQWFAEVAAGFGSPTVVVSSITPCTFFQLQCWWYPFLFFSLYLGVFMLVGIIAKVSDRGLLYMAMASLTLAGLIQVLMGLLPLAIPLTILVLSIIYTLRVKG